MVQINLLICFLFLLHVAARRNHDNFRASDDIYHQKRRHCNSKLKFESIPLSSLRPLHFRPFARVSVRSDHDCARKCIERSSFCSAVRFIHSDGSCLFSAKWIPCRRNGTSSQSSSSMIMHCIRCAAELVENVKSAVRRRPIVTGATPLMETMTTNVTFSASNANIIEGSTTQRESESTHVISIVTETSATDPNVISTITRTQTSYTGHNNFTSITTDATTTITTTNFSNFAQAIAFLSTTTAMKTKVGIGEKFKRPDSSKSHAGLINFPARMQIRQFKGIKTLPKSASKSVCPLEMLRPCNYGFGRGCQLTIDRTDDCAVCSCPYKSPARGCAGAQGLHTLVRIDMLMRRVGCPNGYRMQIVHRWHRRIDQALDIDDCYLVKEPYCGWQQDVNIWRMPRTKDDCYYYCYTDQELMNRNITFIR